MKTAANPHGDEHQKEDAGCGPTQGSRSASPSQKATQNMQGSQGVSFLKRSKIWNLPAIQSRAVWSKVTFQARHNCPLQPGPCASLHPSLHSSHTHRPSARQLFPTSKALPNLPHHHLSTSRATGPTQPARMCLQGKAGIATYPFASQGGN